MPAANRLLAMEEGDLGECERIVRSRKAAVNVAKRAQMLVLAARGLSNRQIALELSANEHVVGRVRKEYRQRGLAVLEDRVRPGRPRYEEYRRGFNLVGLAIQRNIKLLFHQNIVNGRARF